MLLLTKKPNPSPLALGIKKMRKVTLGDIEATTRYAWSLLGTPYRLGGNVPQDGGMDCSAFCLELLRSLGLWGTDDANCQMIYDRFIRTPVHQVLVLDPIKLSNPELREGDFLLFGTSTSSLSHITYALNGRHMLEAGGTDKTGMIRLRKQSWRKDLVAVLRFV